MQLYSLFDCRVNVPRQARGPGRPLIGLERKLRLYFLQQWFGLADEALEDAVYDSQAYRGLLGLDLGREAVPDATTLLKFRHLLETKALTKTLKDCFYYRKRRYQGRKKNGAQHEVLFALANLIIAKPALLAAWGALRPT